MQILFWGLTISLVGKVFVVMGVLWAHTEIVHEHRIDQKVLRTFRAEKVITIVGLLLILFGYFLEIYFYGFTPFFDCTGENCFAQLISATNK